jgi:hypothetical protein
LSRGFPCAVLLAALFAAGAGACRPGYRVGEYVLVELDGEAYPAYIVELKANGRFRVHYEGYDTRWDEDVGLERIQGLARPPIYRPPPPERVRRLEGTITTASGHSAPPSAYKAGDRVRVRWRGSVYPATIVEVLSNDRFVVQYDGHEAAWNEAVGVDRIVLRR